jgi:hypothetical protein
LSVGGGTTYVFDSTGNLKANTVSTGGTQRIDASGNLTNIGTTQFNGLTYTWPAAQTPNYVLQTNGTGTLSWVAQTGGGGTNYWRSYLGALSPLSDSYDLLLGNQATSSAKIGLININSGIPTATISGSIANVASYINGNGILGTTNNQTLTLGAAGTGNIVLAPGGTTTLTAVGANTTLSGTLSLPNSATIIGDTSYLRSTTGLAFGADQTYYINSSGTGSLNALSLVGTLTLPNTNTLTGVSGYTQFGHGISVGGSTTYHFDGSGNLVANSISSTSLTATGLTPGSIVFAGVGGLLSQNNANFYWDNTNNRLGLGTSGTGMLATLDARSTLGTLPTASISGATSQAELVVDQSGVGDLFTASKSGATKFVIANNGNVGIGVANPTSKLQIAGSTSTISNDSGDITIIPASGLLSLSGNNIGNLNNITVSNFAYFAGGTTYYVDNAGNAKFLNIQATDTTNPGLTVGNGSIGFTKIGGSTIYDNAGNLTLASDTNNLSIVGNATASGNITMGGQLQVGSFTTSPTALGSGSVYYNSTATTGGASGNNTGDLFVYGQDSAWHRIALDMTQYASSAANVANGSYIQITHAQTTNDLSLTGWVFDTISGLWKQISDMFTHTVLNNLNNQFNPTFTQKNKVTAVSLQYQNDSTGTGADGAITVSSNTSINSTSLIAGRSCADGGDAVNYSVTALSATSATLESAPSTGCLAVGDEILLINMRGTNTAMGNTGNWETLRISSISTNVVTFTTAKTKYYGDGASDDTNIGLGSGNQAVMLQRVPNYTNVTVNAGVNFNPDAWVAPAGVVNNGAGEGGVMFFRATGAVAVNGTITASALGYIGPTNTASAGASPNGNGGSGGEGFCGPGGAGAYSSNPGGSGAAGGGTGYESTLGNGGNGYCGGGGGTGVAGAGLGSASQGGAGGGGKNIGGGGGGGYGSGGFGGAARATTPNGGNGGTNSSGNGGVGPYAGGGGGGTYGDANLTKLMFGSAGGAGGAYNNSALVPGTGGRGGGIVYIAGASVTVSGAVASNGGAGGAITVSCAAGQYGGGGGAGAGGTVKIVGGTLNLGANKVTASAAGGGAGCENGTVGATNQGGTSGTGRIAIGYSTTISGSTSPAYTSITLAYNPYALYISKEINTPNTTSYNNISWTENLPTSTELEVQTRSGATADSTDGTWEAWKPSTNIVDYVMLDDANTYSNWTGTNLTLARGDVARSVSYFEDENESNSGNLTKTTATATNGTADRTISATDISGYRYITLWVRSASPGNVVTLSFGQTTPTEQNSTFYIDQANVWQKIYWDIGGIAAGSRTAVTKLRLTNITNGNVVYFDNWKAESALSNQAGSTISSTPNNYIQYRFILTTNNSANSPSFSNVQINLTQSGTNYTIDASSIIDPNAAIKNQTSRLIGPATLPYAQYSTGTGADGAITVSSNTSINSTSLIAGRSCADGGDAVNYSVTALSATSATLESAPSTGCLAVGDEILLINMRGTNTAMGNTGNWETLRISSISTNVVTFTTAKTKYYGDGASDDTNIGLGSGNQAVMLQRVPNYTNVTVNAGVNFNPDAWVAPAGVVNNGAGEGGVMFFRATGAVAVNGTITASALGYIGPTNTASAGASPNGNGGSGGEGFCGPGGAGAYSSNPGGSGAAGGGTGYESTLGNGGNGYCGGGGGTGVAGAGLGSASQGGAGGGGKNIGGGGGGGYGSGGFGGAARATTPNGGNGGTNSSGNGGVGPYAGGGGGGTYGDANLTKLMFGSAGGAGGAYNNSALVPGTGGRGGGIVYIAGASVTVSGAVASNGGAGGAITVSCAAGQYGGGGGAGAGGTVKIVGGTLNLGANKVTASAAGGGAGCENGTVGATNQGGRGGTGRIATFSSSSISGSTSPAYTVDTSTGNYNNYSVYISKELATIGATSFSTIGWTQNLPSGTMVQMQTRSGNTTNSTDGTWETWKPTTSSIVVDNANTYTNWVGTNATVATGDVTRNVAYYEDENELTPTNLTKFTTTSAGGYAERTMAPIDLSTYQYVELWVRSATAGSVITLGMGQTAATEQTDSVTINASGVWQKVYWDISAIPGTSRNAITKFRITSSQNGNVVYFDNINGQNYLSTAAGSTITSTTNNYIMYRAILSTTTALATPTLSEVRITYNTAAGAQTINDRLPNQNNPDQYNQNIRLNITTVNLDNYKSINLTKNPTGVTLNSPIDAGTGNDGDVTVSTNTNINVTNLITGRSCADGGDAVNYNVTTLTANTATLNQAPSLGCLAVGDEVLLINLQGTNTAFVNVGNYETLRVQNIAQNIITFNHSKSNFYGNNATDDSNLGIIYGTQRVMLQRVPNYNNLVVNAGINFYPSGWNGVDGGVIFFRAKTASIDGTVHANGLGYVGGTQTTGGGNVAGGGQGGEAFCGNGGNGSTGAGANGSAGGGAGAASAAGFGYCGGGGGGGIGGAGSSNQGGAGGGGGGIGGGGGAGYGTPGNGGININQGGIGGNGGTNSSGNGQSAAYGAGGGGGSYGDPTLGTLLMGSGGGAGGSYNVSVGGTGGIGGGIVYIAGNSITVSGSLSSNGNNGNSLTVSCAANQYAGGGGAGAGGSVKLIGNIINFGTNKTTASGGSGGLGCQNGTLTTAGGAAGSGIIAANYGSSISGSSSPAYNVAQVPSNNYSVLVSNEIPTPNAIDYRRISWLADQTPFGIVEVQTRSGASNNATDDTWEQWKTATNSATTAVMLDDANTASKWIPSDSTVAVSQAGVARHVNEYEDEDEPTTTNMTKITTTTNANAYVENHINATDLTNFDFLTAWVYSTASGSTVKLGFGESAATEHETLLNINAANTWQKVYIDISHIPSSERDAVRNLRFTSPIQNNTFYIDNIRAERLLNTPSGSIISSTPNSYLQYRVILASSDPGYKPTLYNIQAEWSDGFKIQQTDSNTVRLYNYSGATQQLRLDAIVFGADLAEWYTTGDDSIGAADVVALTGQTDIFGVPILRKATGPDDKGLIGVISTQAGQTLGLQADNRRLLGLAGRVPVKIDPSSPAIASGDYLTASSSIPGYAVKAEPGDIAIAKAFQSWSPSEGRTALLSLIIQPQPAPILNFEPVSNFLLEKTGTGFYTVKNVTSNSIIKPGLSIAEAIVGNLRAGRADVNELHTDLITPLASGSAVTIVGPVKITTPATSTGSAEPALSVDGTIDASSISARVAELKNIHADTITANNIVADTISANHIEGLDAKIASISSNISDAELTSITDRIKARLSELAGNTPSAADLPTPPEATASSLADLTLLTSATLPSLASDSATLSSLSADFVTINNYLAVIGSATITNLDVTNTLNVSTLQSKSNLLALQPMGGTINLANGTLIVDSTGQVAVNGDLTVKGKILAQSAEIGSISIGNSSSASGSALGQLLSVYNEQGQAVATIDASGSADLAALSTKLITIASSSEASGSATPPALMTTATTSNATAGESVLVSPNTELTINSPYVTANSLVYLTPTGNTDNKVLFVKSKNTCTSAFVPTLATPKCVPAFTVGIDTPASSDISFNWWIIQLKP